MRAQGFSFILLAAILVTFLGLSACGKKEIHQSTIEDAYRLLDEGKNLKAIVLLEREVRRNPEHSDEARTLLASAYMGSIGINIYSIFDSFQDFIFNKSLKNQFFSTEKGETSGDRRDEPESIFKSTNTFKLREIVMGEKDQPKVEKLINELDKTLVTIQKFSIYLNRFPMILERNWPIVESAIDQLNRVTPSSDLYVYKLFIELIYLKSYLDLKVLKNKAFSTKEGLCHFDLSELNEPIQFSSKKLQEISVDLNDAVRLGATRLKKTSSAMNLILRSTEWTFVLQELKDSLSAQSTLKTVESLLRKQMNCI